MGAGSHIVASTALYGGNQNLLHYTLRRFGIDTTFVRRATSTAGAPSAPTPNCCLARPGQPGLDVLDIPTVSAITHDAGVPLLVDSPSPRPGSSSPLAHGADLVYHSGHQVPVGPRHRGRRHRGGWRQLRLGRPPKSGRFAELTQPYDGFHGMVFTEESTVRLPAARAARGLRDFGACMSPHTAWLILQGIETLPLRMDRHMPTPSRWSSFWPPALWWRAWGHPMLDSHPSHALAQSCCPKAARAAVFSFDIKGNREQGKKFIETLKVFSHLANVGDCRSLVIHPASTTHFRMSDEALVNAGISQGTIRLSIGLEDRTT